MNSAKVYLMKQVMQKQDDPLNLQSLPLVAPPADAWPAIEEALRKDRRRSTVRRFAVTTLAAAATIALAVGVVLQQRGAGLADPQLTPPASVATAQAEATAATQPGADGSLSPSGEPDTLTALIALSQRLEGRLRAIRSNVGDLPSNTVVYQVELEDLVVQVDEELSMQPDSVALWSQRVDLLMDLQRLYESRLRREYHQVASL